MMVDLHTHIPPEYLPDLRQPYGCEGVVEPDHHAPGPSAADCNAPLAGRACEHPGRKGDSVVS